MKKKIVLLKAHLVNGHEFKPGQTIELREASANKLIKEKHAREVAPTPEPKAAK